MCGELCCWWWCCCENFPCQSAVCRLWPAVCGLRSAVCGRLVICSLQMSCTGQKSQRYIFIMNVPFSKRLTIDIMKTHFWINWTLDLNSHAFFWPLFTWYHITAVAQFHKEWHLDWKHRCKHQWDCLMEINIVHLRWVEENAKRNAVWSIYNFKEKAKAHLSSWAIKDLKILWKV